MEEMGYGTVNIQNMHEDRFLRGSVVILALSSKQMPTCKSLFSLASVGWRTLDSYSRERSVFLDMPVRARMAKPGRSAGQDAITITYNLEASEL